MGSFTTWTRIEPRTRDDTMPALAARIADPLWMLCRQWQSGELDGSDNGSPITVHLTADISPITQYITGLNVTHQANSLIEPYVDSIAHPPGLLDRARAGQRFLTFLGPLADRFRQALSTLTMPPPSNDDQHHLDDAGLRRAELLTGRGLDGAAIRDAISSDGTIDLTADPPLTPAEQAAATTAGQRYLSWWDDNFPTSHGSWDGERLAAPFRMSATTSDGPIELSAANHRGGPVDWHSFVAGPPTVPNTQPPSTTATLESLPTAMTYPGMPAARWFQFEDGAVDLTRVDAAPDDIGRLLLAEYALLYGNDFFVVPLEVPVGSVARVLTLTVDTCFGERIWIPSTVDRDPLSGARRWRMFHLDGATPDERPVLILAPSTVAPMRSPQIENVLITRDEMANLGWIIERQVRSPLGTSVDRREVLAGNERRTGTPTVTTNEPHYTLATPIPANWSALEPHLDGRLHTVPASGDSRSQLTTQPSPYRILASELPRTGREIALHTRRSRNTDGSIVVWWSHQSRPGRAESSSGLAHDIVTYTVEVPPT